MIRFTIRGQALLSRRLVSVVCAGSLALQLGCYSYTPVQSQQPARPDRISITLNDRGRQLLAERVGPLLDRIEGRFVSSDTVNVIIAVNKVVNLRNEATNWTGEKVSIPREGILGFQDRPYSRSKTFALIGALVGGALLVITSISLGVVGGSGKKDPPGGDPSES
jgi:hypothetical protein